MVLDVYNKSSRHLDGTIVSSYDGKRINYQLVIARILLSLKAHTITAAQIMIY